MMRAIVLLAGLCVASAHDQGLCMLNGARAVDDLMDGVMFTWAATVRCDKKRAATVQDPIRCSLNIASAIESVNAMVNVVLKAVEQCGHLEGDHPKCGLAVGVLTRAFAGLAASSSGIIAKCPNGLNGGKPLVTFDWTGGGSGVNGGGQTAVGSAVGAVAPATVGNLGECIVNMKDSLKSSFKAMSRIMTVKDNCDGDHARECAHNSLKVVAAIAAIGEYVSGSIGSCTTNLKLAADTECAQEALGVVRHLHNVGRASVEIHKHCEEGATRLYELEHGIAPSSTGSGMITLGLAAFLPIAAVFGFMGGSRLGKADVSGSQSFNRLNLVAEQDANSEM